jgi:hypothetical protein
MATEKSGNFIENCLFSISFGKDFDSTIKILQHKSKINFNDQEIICEFETTKT